MCIKYEICYNGAVGAVYRNFLKILRKSAFWRQILPKMSVFDLYSQKNFKFLWGGGGAVVDLGQKIGGAK